MNGLNGSDLNSLVQRYLAVWNEPDGDARTKAIADLFTEDGSYCDPLASVRGHPAIEAVVSTARSQFPGFEFRLGKVDTHHNIARFTWELVPANGGDALVIGFDVVVANGEGRLTAVYGFLDKVPST